MAPGHQLLLLARLVALVAHDGQSRKGTGEAYFNHPERVADLVSALGWEAATIAYLHDVVEDTPVGLPTLDQLRFPYPVLAAVNALTRKDYETYAEFTRRTLTTGSDTALQVKLADLHDNLTDKWLAGRDGLRRRYAKADSDIRAELVRRGVDPLVFS